MRTEYSCIFFNGYFSSPPAGSTRGFLFRGYGRAFGSNSQTCRGPLQFLTLKFSVLSFRPFVHCRLGFCTLVPVVASALVNCVLCYLPVYISNFGTAVGAVTSSLLI